MMYAIQTRKGWVKEDPSARSGFSVGSEKERWVTCDEQEAVDLRNKLNAGTVVALGVPVFMRGGFAS